MGTPHIESMERRRLFAVTVAAEATPTGVGSIHGFVFRDANRDGVRQSTEAGQANVRLYLDYNNNGAVDAGEPTVLTSSTGTFRFTDAKAPAAVPVRLLLTGTNFVQTQPANNAARIAQTTVGGDVEVESFGVAENLTPPPTTGALTGLVYTDLDRNGTRGSTEAGRANVSVYVDLNNDGLRETNEPLTLTTAEGRYTFTGLTAGDKTIRLLLTNTNLEQTQPTGGAARHASVVAGATTAVEPFGVAEKRTTTTAIVRGTVWYDTNQDGTYNGGEYGRANVRVYLDLNNDGVRESTEPTVLSDANGRYVFSNAPVRSDLHIRLDLTGTNLRQTFPASNAARVVTTHAGETIGDQLFGVHEVPVVV